MSTSLALCFFISLYSMYRWVDLYLIYEVRGISKSYEYYLKQTKHTKPSRQQRGFFSLIFYKWTVAIVTLLVCSLLLLNHFL